MNTKNTSVQTRPTHADGRLHQFARTFTDLCMINTWFESARYGTAASRVLYEQYRAAVRDLASMSEKSA